MSHSGGREFTIFSAYLSRLPSIVEYNSIQKHLVASVLSDARDLNSSSPAGVGSVSARTGLIVNSLSHRDFTVN